MEEKEECHLHKDNGPKKDMDYAIHRKSFDICRACSCMPSYITHDSKLKNIISYQLVKKKPIKLKEHNNVYATFEATLLTRWLIDTFSLKIYLSRIYISDNIQIYDTIKQIQMNLSTAQHL